jgi:hypothetical protein
MSNRYDVEYTDTFGGEANYSWVRRDIITMPELTHYGYTGSSDGSWHKANKVQQRELMRKAKAAMGLTNVRGKVDHFGDMIEFRPYRSNTVMFIIYSYYGNPVND